jgi:hypothetical protein
MDLAKAKIQDKDAGVRREEGACLGSNDSLDRGALGMASVCKHWLRGSCRFAKSCKFMHGHDDARDNDPDKDDSDASTPDAHASTPDDDDHDADPDDAYASTPATRKKGWPRTQARVWMHILLRKAPGFDLVPMLIGVKGQNTKAIFEETGAKIRIRGKGSKYLEVDGLREAPVPLMIAITQDKTCMDKFHKALKLTIALLRKVTQSFKTFCKNGGLGNLADEPIFSRGAMSRGAERCLTDLLHYFPRSSPQGGATSSQGGAAIARSSLRAEAKAFEPMAKGNVESYDEHHGQSYFKNYQPFWEYIEPHVELHVDPHTAVELYGVPTAAWQEWPSGQPFFQVKIESELRQEWPSEQPFFQVKVESELRNDQIQSEAPAEDEFATCMKEAVMKFVSEASDSE